ncbi:hypothetical protein GMRT_12999 [Giardia muris]|uniref:Uncharacterized protein n=1 Tax=Giardia muris TaxID=5742 RepID=A0A4Z1SX38_GIAMU|nr:hypothetical protein GMRT_12999 [Giardia muris]|eukprot:TNJ30304.1 hypothetical protein GMRT_12999 [Giardia muris]
MPQSGWKGFWRQNFWPLIVDLDHGVSRIVSLDFARGIAILGMVMVHSIFNMTTVESILTFDHWLKYIQAILLIPLLLFAPLRGFFAIISGAAFSFLGGQAIISIRESHRSFISWYFIGFARGLLMFFLLWGLDIAYCYSIGLWQIYIPTWNFDYRTPIYKVAFPFASPMSYFAFSMVADSLLFPPLFLACWAILSHFFPTTRPNPTNISRISSMPCPDTVSLKGDTGTEQALIYGKSTQMDIRGSIDDSRSGPPPIMFSAKPYMYTCFTASVLFYVLSLCFILPESAVQSSLGKHLGVTGPELCFIDDQEIVGIKDSSSYVKALFIVALGGQYYPFFPYYGATLVGFSFGLLLLGAYYSKKEYNQKRTNDAPVAANGTDLEIARKRYSDLPYADPTYRKLFLIIGGLMASGMFLSGLISLIVQGHAFKGMDGSLRLDGYCMPPAEMMLITGINLFIMYWFIMMFEGGTVRDCCVRTQRVNFILRFSTVSLNLFVLQIWIDMLVKFVPSRFFPNIIGQKETSAAVVLSIIPLILLNYWFFTSASDSINNMWTLDWALSRIGGMITGKYGKQRPLSDNHRCIRPLCLLAREPRRPKDMECIRDPHEE